MKVIGYGDNVVDRYLNMNKMFPGGNCINFAVYAKIIGVESAYLGIFGDDREAMMIKSTLEDFGVDISGCKTEPGSVTERCDVNIDESGNRVFVQFDEREELHGILELKEQDIKYLEGFDLIHCSCYAEEESEIPKLKDLPGIKAFDFSEEEEYRTEEYLDAICPYIDFALFSCEGMEEEEIKALVTKVRDKGVSYILATMGPHGQIFFDGEEYYHGKAKIIKAIDTMGAGDSFFTAFLMSLLKSGWRRNQPATREAIQEALRFAADFAADNCRVEGSFGCSSTINREGK
ncbi:MAG: PfkB family carbohydrate kinase [Clostridiales bacterium]|nr:PfkB family carbohydrate kinase [Clostridiales bacterium]